MLLTLGVFTSVSAAKVGDQMSTKLDASVLPVQQMMAWANPSRWEDGFVVEAFGNSLVVATLEGATKEIRVVGHAVELVAGEPVAYHPVAELLHAGSTRVTAVAVTR